MITGTPVQAPAKDPLCKHSIIVLQILAAENQKRIVCKKCKHEIARWQAKLGWNFDEEYFKKFYVFGSVPDFDPLTRHEYR